MSEPAPPNPEIFPLPDVSFAKAWAELAPGLGGWHVAAEESEGAVRLVSVVPPGAELPAFFLSRDEGETVIQRLRPMEKGGALVEAGRFKSLREAVLALCPLNDDALQQIHEHLEQIFPRDRRN